jgi:hypothetical protein
MTHPIKYISALLLTALCAGSCTAPIELTTKDSEPVIVIYGALTEYTMPQTVRISGSSPYFAEKSNTPVSNAEVMIQASNGHTYKMKELSEEKGIYQTEESMAAVAGVTYRLSVQVDFNRDGALETYEATTTMPPAVDVDSVTVTIMDFMGYKHYSLNLYALEGPEEDFYLARYIINDTLMEYQISNYLILSDLAINDQYLYGLPLMYLDDEANRDNGFVEEEAMSYVHSGDKITLCLSRIEEGYYEFIRQCQTEKRGENPFFGGPASNITTNISHGGVGYFVAFSTTATDVYIP